MHVMLFREKKQIVRALWLCYLFYSFKLHEQHQKSKKGKIIVP